MLTPEQKNDLRRRVLAGEHLSVEIAKQIIDDLRAGRRLAAEAGPKTRKSAGKRVMSDAELDKDLDSALGI